jgi:uncharacterized protein involved in cysteine biosynthesis
MFLLPAIRALGQLDDRTFLAVVVRSVLCSLAAFLALAVLLSWAGHRAAESLGQTGAVGWLGWLGYAAGPIGAAVLAVVLFLPLASVIATLYVDRVARAVEERWYPWVPPAAPAPLHHQLWDGLALGLKVLALQVLALLLALFVPGAGLLLGWLITAWAIGRGLFVALAMRRMGRLEARLLCRRRLPAVLAQGGWIALLAMVPVLNLLAPVLGTAALVHVFHAGNRNDLVPAR